MSDESYSSSKLGHHQVRASPIGYQCLVLLHTSVYSAIGPQQLTWTCCFLFKWFAWNGHSDMITGYSIIPNIKQPTGVLTPYKTSNESTSDSPPFRHLQPWFWRCGWHGPGGGNIRNVKKHQNMIMKLKPRESKNQTLPIGSGESFIYIIPKAILCLVLDFQGKW